MIQTPKRNTTSSFRLIARIVAMLPPLALAGLVLASASCKELDPTSSCPAPVIDTAPLGDGLKVIGYGVLGAAVVVVLGRMLR
jgi:hypothetical protein